jgi:hypothetical protein
MGRKKIVTVCKIVIMKTKGNANIWVELTALALLRNLA